MTSITVNFLNGSIVWEGSYSGAGIDQRAAAYEFNNDDDLADFKAFMFDATNTLIIDANIGSVSGFDGDDTFLFTAASNNSVNIFGGAGYDTATFQQLGRGFEAVWHSTGVEMLVGSSRDDILYALPERFDEDLSAYVFVSGQSAVYGGSGDDVIHGSLVGDELFGSKGNDIIYGDSDRSGDTAGEGSTADDIRGGSGDDIIHGGGGNDDIRGGSGDDVIAGGLGADGLNGGSGADRFVFRTLADSPAAGRDRILEFDIDGGDVIDLSQIDANSNLDGNQAFTFLGTGSYTGAGGELRVSYRDTGDAVVTVDVDGDGSGDLNILLRGITDANQLTAGDFVL
ncbi:calcium-binding protein [Methylobrevis pamukkalensis]|uniref:calcium-binding protein n=1 Tax=Methylobrevis pamukkalensis TaxID=1439726 RepID=UPI001471EAB4|nr:hypothetical protein [Methylobrevis pamukkalensis]